MRSLEDNEGTYHTKEQDNGSGAQESRIVKAPCTRLEEA